MRNHITSGKETAVAPALPPSVQGVILDCDGVLFDSKEANTAYYNHIRNAVRLPPMTEAEAAYSHMASIDEALERMIPPDLRREAMEIRAGLNYGNTFMPMMTPAPYVFQFLKGMREKGVPLALCTNRSDSVHLVLQNFGMESFFSPVMTISQARPKPDPEGLLKIVQAWSAIPEGVIFLGDSLVDKQAAANAGVPFWSFSNPELSARMHVSTFREVDEILGLMLME